MLTAKFGEVLKILFVWKTGVGRKNWFPLNGRPPKNFSYAVVVLKLIGFDSHQLKHAGIWVLSIESSW